jgi:hypothetical protein
MTTLWITHNIEQLLGFHIYCPIFVFKFSKTWFFTHEAQHSHHYTYDCHSLHADKRWRIDLGDPNIVEVFEFNFAAREVDRYIRSSAAEAPAERGGAEKIRTRIGQLINFDAVARVIEFIERDIVEFAISEHPRRRLARRSISFERNK